jgi:hypothetical protein
MLAAIGYFLRDPAAWNGEVGDYFGRSKDRFFEVRGVAEKEQSDVIGQNQDFK